MEPTTQSINELLASYLHAAPDPIVIVDAGGAITFFNERAEEVFGYLAADIVGRSVDILVPDETRPGHVGHRDSFGADPHRRPMGAEGSLLMARRADGTEFPVEISLSPITTGGELTVMAAVRDVSTRLDAEKRLRTSERSFRAAFDGAPVAMIMLNIDNDDQRIVKVNGVLGDLLGYSQAELVDESMANLFSADSVPLTGQYRARSTRVRLRHKDGSAIWCWLHAADLHTEAGARAALVHIVDISAQVDAEIARDHREQFLIALGDIRAEILTERASARVLDLITEQCRQLWPGCSVVVATSNADGDLEARAVRDDSATVAEGQIIDSPEELWASIPGGSGARTVVAPFAGGVAGVDGVLVLACAGEPFAAPTMVEALAAKVAMSLQLEAASIERRRQLVTADRERIARDLHDLVIQRLFSAGMSLQSAIAAPDLGARALEVVNELDETISVIRNTIFKLTAPDSSLSEQIRAVVESFQTPVYLDLKLDLDGGLDEVGDHVAGHLLATLNEALSNAIRHAEASTIEVRVAVADEVELTVSDDGIGFDHFEEQGRGLINMAEGAAAVDGRLSIDSDPGTGTVVRWQSPNEPTRGRANR